MNPSNIAALCVILILTICASVQAQDQGPWWTWSTIDGNWGGYRDKLADRGLVFSGITDLDMQGNVWGGQVRAFAAADSSLLAVDADLQTLAGIKGTLVHAEFVANGGENLSSKSLDNVLEVATAFAQPGYYLGQLFVEQKLFGEKLIIDLGRLTTANNFASLPVFSEYLSFAVNPIPVSLTNNTPYFTSLPGVEWGAVGTVELTKSIEFAAAIYNTNLPSGLPYASQHGLDFSFDGNGGPMEVSQLTYNPNSQPDDKGLPGTYYIGGYYSGADYETLSDEGRKRGDHGFYFEAQQMVYREGGAGSDVGLTPWISITSTPRQSINELPLLVMAGAVYHGLIHGRDDDSTALAFYYGELSTDLASGPAEKVLELAYTFWATPWLGITPDFQYVFNPKSRASSSNAPVLGAQVQILF
jgi:porin